MKKKKKSSKSFERAFSPRCRKQLALFQKKQTSPNGKVKKRRDAPKSLLLARCRLEEKRNSRKRPVFVSSRRLGKLTQFRGTHVNIATLVTLVALNAKVAFPHSRSGIRQLNVKPQFTLNTRLVNRWEQLVPAGRASR